MVKTTHLVHVQQHQWLIESVFTIPIATRATTLVVTIMVTLVVLVVAKVMVAEEVVEVGSNEVLPVAVVLRHPAQAPTPPWLPRVLSKSASPTSTL